MRLEAKHDPRRYPDIILARPKESCLHVVSLKPPRNGTDNLVVQPAAQRRRKRCVGAQAVIHVDMAGTEQRFREGTKPSDGERHSRPKQKIPLGDTGVERETVSTVAP